jgi:hypothetical protein
MDRFEAPLAVDEASTALNIDVIFFLYHAQRRKLSNFL